MEASEIATIVSYCVGAFAIGYTFGFKIMAFKRFLELSTRG